MTRNDGGDVLSFAEERTMARLPEIHGDPFDRLLIAKAIHENLMIVTGDEKIAKYPVQTIWR